MIGLLMTWLFGLVGALALMTLVWVVSVYRRDASVVDIFWGKARQREFVTKLDEKRRLECQSGLASRPPDVSRTSRREQPFG